MNSQKLNTIYVFVNSSGDFGNPVGIVMDLNKSLSYKDRLKISHDSRYSETVFIENLDTPKISIFNPQEEVDFAGHAILGTYWYFENILKIKTDTIKCKTAIISCLNNKLYWIKSDIGSLPTWNFLQLDNSTDVETFSIEKALDLEHTVAWAYFDDSKDIIRARTFASDWGIPEDEANGSGAMLLASKLNKKIKIIHGKGSEIYAEPRENKEILLGGRCCVK